jgi:hypothetical protein
VWDRNVSDKRKQFQTIFAKFQKLIPLLGSPVAGEAENARRKINDLLAKAKLDWHDVLELMSPQQDSLLEMLMRLLEKETDTLVRLAQAGATFFCSPKKLAFADVKNGDHRLTLPLTGKDFSEWLLHQYFTEKKKAPKLASERDAIRTLSAFAKFDGGPRQEVYLRSAQVGEKIYLDIGDDTGQVIEISATDWQVIANAPVKFQRMPGMAALPIPTRSGNIFQLHRFVNLTDSDFVLYVAVLVNALYPGREHAVLNLIGESGSGKTTAARIARSLTDPSDVLTGALPREPRDLFVDVSSSFVLAYDNVGSIPKRISDGLCQITSGTGYRKRKLFTDLEQVLVGGYRAVILTGVHNAITEPDLAERAITMNLAPVAANARRSKEQLTKQFERERPAILGALLDIVAHGLKQLPQTHVRDLPRLADFALLGVAIEEAFTTAGAFLAAFHSSQAIATDTVVEADPVTTAIAAFMENRDAWHGTTALLWHELQARDQSEARPTETKLWPHDPISFGIALTQGIATLRKIGIEVIRDRATSRSRTRMVHLRRIDQEEQSPEQSEEARASDRLDRSDRSDGSEPQESDRAVAKIVPLLPRH